MLNIEVRNDLIFLFFFPHIQPNFLFAFLDISNSGLEEGAEKKDAIHDQGMLNFQKSITGNNDDDDPVLLILAWKLNCEKVWEISHEEFVTGFTLHA